MKARIFRTHLLGKCRDSSLNAGKHVLFDDEKGLRTAKFAGLISQDEIRQREFMPKGPMNEFIVTVIAHLARDFRLREKIQ